MTESPNPGSRGELSPYHILRDPLPEFPEEPAPHLREYWRTLINHGRSALAAFLACVIGVAAYTFTRTPLYTAGATIQIERQAPRVTDVQEVRREESNTYDKYDYYETQFGILGSRTIAARVINRLGLTADPRFAAEEVGILTQLVIRPLRASIDFVVSTARPYLPFEVGGEAPEPIYELGVESRWINRYLNDLEVEAVRNSRLVEVRFTSRHPALSAAVANAHVEEYIASAMEGRLETTNEARKFLDEELAKAKERLGAAEAKLNEFRKANRVVGIEGQTGDIVTDRLTDLNKEYTQAQADRIQLEGQCSLIDKHAFEDLPAVGTSLLIAQLKQQLAGIEAERAELQQKFKPGYPKMREVMARESEVRGRINREIGKILTSVKSACLAARNRETELERELGAQREKALAQKDVTADYATLLRDSDSSRAVYTELISRAKDIDVVGEIRMSNISIVDRAAVPTEPSYPMTLLFLAVAGVVGTFLGVGLAFILEYLDNTVKTQEDVEYRLGLPMLGLVPHFDALTRANAKRRRKAIESNVSASENAIALPAPRDGGTSRDRVVIDEPRSAASEAYRVVRNAILLSSADNVPRVLVFTSGIAGEGKTITAINEALTLVQAGGRVLLVDADIRRPRLHQVFDLPTGHGLSTYLAGQSSMEAVVHPIIGHAAGDAIADNGTNGGNGNGNGNGAGHGCLSVIPAGPPSPNPAELLGSRRMARTVEALRDDYDYIIMDTPPVLAVADTVALSRISDGVVLVVHGQHTSMDVVAKCRDRLRQVKAPILGVVLNNVDPRSSDYDAYCNSPYYYES